MTKYISAFLLFAILALLAYQLIYKEYSYRRAVLAERESLLETLSLARESTRSARKAYYAACTRNYVGRACVEAQDKLSVANGVERKFENSISSLYRAVLNRYDGIAPDWWAAEKKKEEQDGD
jgi:hypothetical protein